MSQEYENNYTDPIVSADEDQEINIDDFFDDDDDYDADYELKDSFEDVLRSVNEGSVSAGLFLADENGETVESGEYDDCRVNVSILGDVAMLTFIGSKDSIDSMWNILERFRVLTAEKFQSEDIDMETGVPICTLIVFPDEYYGERYFEFNFPKIWSLSANQYGAPADQLRIAFPTELSDLCRMEPDYSEPDYSDEEYEDYAPEDPWFQELNEGDSEEAVY